MSLPGPSVSRMKNVHTPHNSRPLSTARQNERSFPQRAAEIRLRHPDLLERARAIVRHPRSLARPIPQWRPPVIELSPVAGMPELSVAVSRYRVGNKAQARLRLAQSEPTAPMPVYLLSCRFTTFAGTPLQSEDVNAWMEALLGSRDNSLAYLLNDGSALVAAWVVDKDFRAVPTPPELFQRPSAA